MTDAQNNALDAFLKADAEADAMAKLVVVYLAGDAPDCSQLTPSIIEMARKASNFYKTPQLAKIVDAKE